MRVEEPDRLGAGERQAAVPVDRVGVGLFFVLYAMLEGCFSELFDQPVGRVEGCDGRLRHIGDSFAPKLSFGLFRCCNEVFAAKQNLAAGDAATASDVAHRSQPEHGFSGARLADQADDAPTRPVEIHTFYDFGSTAVSAARVDAKPTNRQHVLRRLDSSRARSTRRLTQTARRPMAAAGTSGVTSP